MKEFDNYKYLFFKELYKELNLTFIEEKLKNEKIKPLNVLPNEDYELISNYFFLLNDINIEKLTPEQLREFHYYFSRNIKELSEQELIEAKKFISNTYSMLLFPNVEDNYVYYGPVSDEYVAPKDAIAIGLYYDAFVDCHDFEIENKLTDIINYIQFNLAKKINNKVSIILFNQLTLENRHSDFVK